MPFVSWYSFRDQISSCQEYQEEVDQEVVEQEDKRE